MRSEQGHEPIVHRHSHPAHVGRGYILAVLRRRGYILAILRRLSYILAILRRLSYILAILRRLSEKSCTSWFHAPPTCRFLSRTLPSAVAVRPAHVNDTAVGCQLVTVERHSADVVELEFEGRVADARGKHRGVPRSP